MWTLRGLIDRANSTKAEINGKWVPARPSPVCVKLRINHKGNISRVAVLHALRRLGHDAHFFDGPDGPLLVVSGRE
jgi:hypothetical protein